MEKKARGILQWRRSVVKYGVRVSQIRPSNCFRLHPTSMISKQWNSYRKIYGSVIFQQSWFLAACRRLDKNSLPSIFDASFILDGVKLAELSNNRFQWKNV